MEEFIVASDHYHVLTNDNVEHSCMITIYRPKQVDNGDWKCPCRLGGIDTKLRYIWGVSSIQAVSAAFQLAYHELVGHIERGAQISDAQTGDAISLEELRHLFGAHAWVLASEIDCGRAELNQ